MLQLYWEDMPGLAVLSEWLRPWGDLALTGRQTLRLIPYDPGFPPTYFNQNGSIDMVVSGLDLFEQDDCIERLQRWLGVS